ncbi:MAG: AMP-binding protein, partial [Myxococcales bacterium]|nr:AMP-binding protein [Myxococcales bacterium]
MSHGNGNGHGGHGDPGHGVAVHAPAQLTTSDGERAVVRAIDPDTADRIGIAVMDLQEGRPLPHLKWGPEGTYHHAPPSHATVPNLPEGAELDVTAALAGKTILLIGTTGFVGKVALSMLLCKYPDVRRVYCLVRPGAGNTADERFYKKVVSSPAFDPLRAIHGDATEAFLRAKIVAIPGDIGRPLCNFDDAQLQAFADAGGLDVIINSAGLVSFMPSLESALRINANGAKHVLEVARRTKAKLVHVSTCYVCGQREGDIWEDEPVVGYFPRKDDLRDRDFDAAAEAADCQRIIDQTRERSNDRQHISLFRERAARALEAQRRDPDDEDDLKLAVARERKIWMAERLTRLGMERAEHWGWTNTYTYTKSLGEQMILADREVVSTVVRPAVVESAVRFPFPGWNEGFNTTAPLVYLVVKGHRSIVAGVDTTLDLIPVDFIAAGMLLATAAILEGVHQPVYQLGGSDSNRVTSRRLTELTGLAARTEHREQAKAETGIEALKSRLKVRLESMPVTYDQFNRRSAPLFKRLAEGLSARIDDHLPRWGTPRLEAWAERAKDELGKISRFTGQVIDLIEMFKPFNYDRDIIYRCDNIRALWRACTPADREALWWGPEAVDWREYWIGVHFSGLKKWVFPQLDDEFGPKPRSVYTYKELLEMWDATVKLHRHRVALELRRTDPDAPPITFTYERLGIMSQQGSGVLRQVGVAHGDRVMLMSENRPEWGISYFAILQAGAAAVPLDRELSPAEVVNLARASGAKVLVASRKVAERLCGDVGLAVPVIDDADGGDVDVQWSPAHRALAGWLGDQLGAPVEVLSYDDLLAEPDVSAGAVPPPVRGDTVASVIFTSGTTGTPKGVMLTHKNLTSMVAKLAATFQLYRHDALLSVLPLHHTFEFSAGFLMPLMHGSKVTYLEEIDADSLGDALRDGGITGMVGVPALWQLLERKIWKTFSDRGVLAEKAFEAVVDANRGLRDSLPYGVGIGRILFYPVHRKLGGRLRLLISGGSALPADTMKSFVGLGFDLYEGYGMTESSPVLTVTRPGDKPVPGSVGRPLPGIDVRIDQPDERGVGEVIAKGPNVMAGYYQNPEATAQTLVDGWLHTGDLGRFDADGNLYIVGRKKEMILGASGENIYPDELESLYGDSKYVKELSVVGLPSADGAHETVAALIVPEYDQGDDGPDREAVREHVRDHVREVSKTLPLYKRLKAFHLWDFDLPKTSTRKVKRRDVIKELTRLERAARGGAEVKRLGGTAGDGDAAWIRDVILGVAQKKGTAVTAETRLEDLGFDSLMFTELAVALEAAGVELPDPSELTGLETIGDVERLVARLGAVVRRNEHRPRPKKDADKRDDGKQADDIDVPAPLVRAGRRVLRRGMKELYGRYLDTRIHGEAYRPPFGGYIIAANHSSHLDMGLCKYALGDQGDALVALAAKDYFFEDPVRRMYFENFTNLVPMERYGSLRESLRLAADVLRQGYILLIFPEGTRSTTGEMIDFKPSLGYLALTNHCGILPMYLAGNHDAMPKGRYLPHRGAEVAAHIGPFLDADQVAKMAAGRSRADAYRTISWHVEGVVRRLAPPAYAWTLGEAGTTPLTEWQAARGAAVAPADGDDGGEPEHPAP